MSVSVATAVKVVAAVAVVVAAAVISGMWPTVRVRCHFVLFMFCSFPLALAW